MKKSIWLLLGILACLVIAAGAYFWATGMIDSLYAYRSPLHANPPAPGLSIGEPLTRKVVIVLIDALRADTSMKPEVMPTLNELRQHGAWATMHSRPPSYSDPGYSVILTGAWPDISDGPAVNLEYEETPTFTQDNLYSAAHRAGLKTALSGYYWFEKLVPQNVVDAGFYTPGEDKAADREVVDAALPMLSDSYQLVLIHIDQVDYAGHHEGGPIDPRWDAAARRADDLLREIAAKMDLQKDTLIVLSDHGQIDRGGHGGQDPITLVEPYVMVGAAIRSGHYPDMQQVDVAPTVAALLGTNIPASNQGHVLTDMLNLPEERLSKIHDLLAYQQIQLEQGYVAAIGEQPTKVLVGQGQDVVNVYQQAMEKARNARLNRERTWRMLPALLIFLIPVAILVIRRERKALWFLGGAFLYALLFNLRYAVQAGRTYSLSSVVDKNDILLFAGTTAALALLITWLVSMIVLRAFQTGPRRAAAAALSLTLMIIYLLSLPALLSYAINGLLITWTLPDLLTMFLGFLSVMQGLIVAAIGLLLTGLTALIAMFVPKSRRMDQTN